MKLKEQLKRNTPEINFDVKVDMSQLEEAIVKANQLVQLLERADALIYRIRKDFRSIEKEKKVYISDTSDKIDEI